MEYTRDGKEHLLKLKLVINYILKGEDLGPANISHCAFFRRQSCKMLLETLPKAFCAQIHERLSFPTQLNMLI